MTGPSFDAYPMVDWGAGNAPKTGADSIWLALAERGGDGALRLACPENPPTRAAARERLSALLTDLLARNKRVLAGFDFPFGYPAGTGAALKLPGAPWRAMWELLAAKIEDDPANRNNRFQVADELNRRLGHEGGPFWGHPTGLGHLCRHGPKSSGYAYCHGFKERRLVEDRYIRKAQPVWKLAYPGAAGSQTLTGLPVVEALRRRFGDRCRVWPFETGLKAPAERAAGSVVLAEIYPALVEPRSARHDVKDSQQVQAMALHLAELDSRGALAAIFAGPAGLPNHERQQVEREEGWILGVMRQGARSCPVAIDAARHG